MSADFKQGTQLAGKILASGQVASASTDTTVYTVPALSAVKVATATLTNVGSSSAVVHVHVVPSGSSVDVTRRVVHNYQLASGDSMILSEIAGAMLDTGAFISVNASQAASVNYLLTGAVSS